MEHEPNEVLLFPLSNDEGFRVVDADTYAHMIGTIVRYTMELEDQFPNNAVWVIYRVEDEK